MCDQCTTVGGRRTPPNAEEKAEADRLFRLHVAEARRYGEMLGHPSEYDDPWVELELTLFKIQSEVSQLQRLLTNRFN